MDLWGAEKEIVGMVDRRTANLDLTSEMIERAVNSAIWKEQGEDDLVLTMFAVTLIGGGIVSFVQLLIQPTDRWMGISYGGQLIIVFLYASLGVVVLIYRWHSYFQKRRIIRQARKRLAHLLLVEESRVYLDRYLRYAADDFGRPDAADLLLDRFNRSKD